MAKDKKVWIWIVGIVALAFIVFNPSSQQYDNGLISVNLYDPEGNLMAIVDGRTTTEVGYTLNVVNTGDTRLDFGVTLTGSPTAYNSFLSVPECRAMTDSIECLFTLDAGQTKVLTGARIDANAIAPTALTLDATANAGFYHYGDFKVISQSDSSIVIIEADAVIIQGCMDSSASNHDPQAAEDNGRCVYPNSLIITDLENAEIFTTSPSSGEFSIDFKGGSYESSYDQLVHYGVLLSISDTFSDIEPNLGSPIAFIIQPVDDVISPTFEIGDYITLTYDSGQRLNVYLPAMDGSVEWDNLFAGTDGCTYYDPGLTNQAACVIPIIEDFNTVDQTPLYTSVTGNGVVQVDILESRLEGSSSSYGFCRTSGADDYDSAKMTTLSQDIARFSSITFIGSCYAEASAQRHSDCGPGLSQGTGACTFGLTSSPTLSSYISIPGARAVVPCSVTAGGGCGDSATVSGTFVLDRIESVGSPTFTFNVYKDGIFMGTTEPLSGDINLVYVGDTLANCDACQNAPTCINCPEGSSSHQMYLDRIEYRR